MDNAAWRGLERYRSANGELLALVIRSDFRGGHYNFFTPDDFPLQVGTSFYSADETIEAHTHIPHLRTIELVNEFVLVKSGRVRLHLFDAQRAAIATLDLRSGDAVLLTAGGHGFDILEPAQLIEVKQGPYLGVDDKVRFTEARIGPHSCQ